MAVGVPGVRPLVAYLVDPWLYTQPYDASLDAGLRAAGVTTVWATCAPAPGETTRLSMARILVIFSGPSHGRRWSTRPLRVLMECAVYFRGAARLVGRVLRDRPSIVHFQWTPLPMLDFLAMIVLRVVCPVVVTVHDTVPCNGVKTSRLRTLGYDLPIRLADEVIVLTRVGATTLRARGVREERISIIGHGPLIAAPVPPAPLRTDMRYTVVAVGRIQRYKGVDVLIEAVALLDSDVRASARFLIAGKPYMDLAPLKARVRALGLERHIEFQPWLLTEDELAMTLAAADCFVLPYTQIDASGVYHLVKPLNKWIIASRLGVFLEDLTDGEAGNLVEPGDPRSLAAALRHAIRERPRPQPSSSLPQWTDIGEATASIYRRRVRRARGRRGESS